MGAIALIVWSALGYAVGSCPVGYIVVRLMTGDDVRRYGSGGTGATNVSRVLGRWWGIFTAAADMLKGALVLCTAMMCGYGDPFLLACVGVFAVIGHDFPVWLGFRGGKGVATSFAVIALWDFFMPIPAMIGGAVWVAVRETTRYVSLASIMGLAAASACVSAFMEPRAYFAGAVLLTLLSAARHKDNIARLIAGTENRAEPVCPKIARYLRRVVSR